MFLPPANEVWGKVIFLHKFVILITGGGHAWLLCGGMHGCWGGMHGCSRGMRGCSGGACVVAPGGMHSCLGGACVVALGVCVWDTMTHRDAVNEQAVHILLECILVTPVCHSVHRGSWCQGPGPGPGPRGVSAWGCPGLDQRGVQVQVQAQAWGSARGCPVLNLTQTLKLTETVLSCERTFRAHLQ